MENPDPEKKEVITATEPVVIPTIVAPTVGEVIEKEKKHNGHQYNSACKCARCMRTTLKFEKDVELETKIIETYISNLPDNKVIVEIAEANFELMISKIEILKQKFPNTKGKAILPEIINTAITNYLKQI